MDIYQQLREFGFSEKEGACYLSLAESGKATATSLSRKTKLSRSSVYFVLESLRKRGLVSAETKNKTTYFAANHPKALREELKQHQKEIEQKLRSADQLSEQLLPYFRSKQFHVPKMQFIEGKRAVLDAFYSREELWHQSMLSTDCTWWGFEDGGIFAHYSSWFEASVRNRSATSPLGPLLSYN